MDWRNCTYKYCISYIDMYGKDIHMGQSIVTPLNPHLPVSTVVPLLLLFCDCGGAGGMVGGFTEMPFDTKAHLISYHTEGQGENTVGGAIPVDTRPLTPHLHPFSPVTLTPNPLVSHRKCLCSSCRRKWTQEWPRPPPWAWAWPRPPPWAWAWAWV